VIFTTESLAGRPCPSLNAGRAIISEKSLFQFFLIADGKLVAAFCTAAGQHFSTIGGLHTLSKTVNSFAAASMGLKCPFHFN
jgi:hypothetical protein